MTLIVRTASLALILVATLFGVTPMAGAADLVFPKASRIGLVPPPGFTASPRFMGFENASNQATLLVAELPEQAFPEMEKELSPEALNNPALGVSTRESLALADGTKAMLLLGRQDINGTALVRWNLVAPAKDMTAVVTMVFPESFKSNIPEADIRAAFSSVRFRDQAPNDELMAVLPFNFSDLAGFRIARVQAGTAAMLTEGPRNILDVNEQPLLVATIGQGATAAEERGNLARRLMGSVPGIKDVRIVRAEPQRIGGQQGFEIIVEGKDARSGADISAAQWIRFSAGGYIRLVAMARKEQWATMFNRFRAVRDGFEPK